MDGVIGMGVALVVAAGVCVALIRLGPKLGFVDRPDGHLKPHELPIVPLGGVGVFTGVHVGLAVAGQFNTGLLIASGMLLVLGLMDDYRDLGPGLRLLIQVIAGAVLAVGADLSAVPDGPLSIVLVAAIVVVTVNAVNLLDGLDGLAGGTALVTALGIAAIAAVRGLETASPGLVLAGAIFGFLLWNWNPARMFFGDNGAYSVALFLVYGFLVATPQEAEVQVVVTTGLLGVFAIDLAVTLIRRRLNGRPLFVGDRSHVYDQLRDRGWSVRRIATTFAAAQGAVAAIVIGVDELLAPLPALLVLGAVFALTVLALGRAGFLRVDAAA